METIIIPDLYNKAYRAYQNLSFSPEKRAEQIVLDYEKELNEDLANIPEQEKQTYIDGYNKHLFAWLAAMSNCYSVMITGGSNFNNSRHERTNNAERRKSDEFVEWREKALNNIAKRVEAAKPIEQRTNEKWESLKKQISQKIEWGSVANCFSMIERLAYNGEVELVNNCLALITEYNTTHAKPFMTSRHKIWALPEIAAKARARAEQMQTKESKDETINGVKVVKNYQADRIQLFFNGKPDCSTISNLKHAAFKWSPSNGCWQRQLTNNAIYATEKLLKSINN
jgi:hypothetical protein